MDRAGEIKKLTDLIIKFRDEREWKQFHTPKNMAISLAIEAAEVLEHFQWRSGEELAEYVKTHKHDIGEELADVFFWVLMMSHDFDIDLIAAFEVKMKKNAEKYPVEKARGKHTKYTQL